MDVETDVKINYKRARSQFNNIMEKIGIILRIPKESISILKPLTISKGMNLKFIINSSTYKEVHNENIQKNDLNDVFKQVNDFTQLLHDPTNQQGLITEITDAWGLTTKNIKLNNITIVYKESKMRKKNTVAIQLNSVYSNDDDDSHGSIRQINTENTAALHLDVNTIPVPGSNIHIPSSNHALPSNNNYAMPSSNVVNPAECDPFEYEGETETTNNTANDEVLALQISQQYNNHIIQSNENI